MHRIHSVITVAVIVWTCIRGRACVWNFGEKPLVSVVLVRCWRSW